MPKAWVKNLETGVRAQHNVGEKGRDFLVQQPKPYLGKDGKFYKDGVWVLDEKPLSKAAQKIVEDAAKAANEDPK